MEYRPFRNLGFQTSILGIGCMRLPLQKQPDGTTDSAKIDEAEAIKLIRYGIDQGVNYVDTAYPYHGGNSEFVVAKALSDGYREKVKLATKMPVWEVKTAEDFDRLLNRQLEKLGTTWIDFYLLHALHQESWDNVRNLGVLDFLDRAKKDGRIRHAAFSFHDELPVFKQIIDSYTWDMCQIQLNILDENYQAGLEGMRYASERGIGIVVMEPLRGGALANRIPTDIQAVWNEAGQSRSAVEWALRWLANIPQINVILSGASTLDQMKDNLRIFAATKPHCLSEEELALVSRVQAMYKNKIRVNCTGCEYCLPCPAGVAIPDVFRNYNNSFLFEDFEGCAANYQKLAKDGKDASLCVSCGACESACPQNIAVMSKLIEAREYLTAKH